MAMTAWSANVFRSSICVVGERPRLRTGKGDGADRHPLAQQGHRKHFGNPCQRLAARGFRTRDRCESWDMDDARRSIPLASQAHRSRLARVEARRARHRTAVAYAGWRPHGQLPSNEVHRADVGAAQSDARSHDRLEHRLDLGRRTADDAKDLAGCRLLLQGLGHSWARYARSPAVP